MRSMRGFTLLELLTVVAIAAILAGVAIPSFTKIIATQKLKSAATNIQVALLTARSEGIKRNTNVCMSTSSSSCTGAGDWSQGWYVLDTSTNPMTVVSSFPPYSKLTITGPSGGVTYQSSGRVTAAAASTFAVSSSSISDVRCVTITIMGVPSVTTSGC